MVDLPTGSSCSMIGERHLLLQRPDPDSKNKIWEVVNWSDWQKGLFEMDPKFSSEVEILKDSVSSRVGRKVGRTHGLLGRSVFPGRALLSDICCGVDIVPIAAPRLWIGLLMLCLLGD